MAQVTGIVCDVCKKIFSTSDEPADVRIKVVIEAASRGTSYDICSSKCLFQLAKTRMGKGDIKPRGSDGGVAANHQRWHVKEGKVNPDCELCQKETEANG